MLDYGPDGNKYRNTDPYPNKDAYTVYYFYKKGQCVLVYGYGHDTEAQLRVLVDCASFIHIKEVLDKAKKQFIVEKELHEDFSKELQQRKEKDKQLIAQWYSDMYEYYGVEEDDPITAKLMSKAYEDGHHAGFQEVENHFSELLDFVNDIKDIIRKTPERYSIGL